MSAIRPNRDQFVALMGAPDDGPVVMLNLVKYKERADDGNGSGGDAYRRYGDQAVQMVEARGGKVLWAGQAEQVLIGNPSEDWDAVFVVQYPSRAAFVEMVTTPEYEKAHEHREAGLERTTLLACRPMLDRFTEGKAG
ncbi:MAG: hypothetical protein JWL83_320 [Actinomycetia bacterium]|nr:hypothetical protein [Actinomycetes bacterium]